MQYTLIRAEYSTPSSYLGEFLQDRLIVVLKGLQRAWRHAYSACRCLRPQPIVKEVVFDDEPQDEVLFVRTDIPTYVYMHTYLPTYIYTYLSTYLQTYPPTYLPTF